jgi:acyl-CoA thioesterase I
VQDVATVLETRPPRALVLAFPSNDAASGYSAAETIANLHHMSALARKHGVPVLVLSSQPRDALGARARDTMMATDTALAVEFDACFVAVRADLSDTSGGIATRYSAGDGVHLNDAGHGLVFDRVWATISSGQCLSPP